MWKVIHSNVGWRRPRSRRDKATKFSDKSQRPTTIIRKADDSNDDDSDDDGVDPFHYLLISIAVVNRKSRTQIIIFCLYVPVCELVFAFRYTYCWKHFHCWSHAMLVLSWIVKEKRIKWMHIGQAQDYTKSRFASTEEEEEKLQRIHEFNWSIYRYHFTGRIQSLRSRDFELRNCRLLLLAISCEFIISMRARKANR